MPRTAADLSPEELQSLLASKRSAQSTPVRTAADLSPEERKQLIAAKRADFQDPLVAQGASPSYGDGFGLGENDEETFGDFAARQGKGLVAGATNVPGSKYAYAATGEPIVKTVSPLAYGIDEAAKGITRVIGRYQGLEEEALPKANLPWERSKGNEGFFKEAEKFTKTTDQWEKDAPVASVIGGLPKDIAMFAGGEAALTKIAPQAFKTIEGASFGKNLLRGAARSGATSAGIGELDALDKGEGFNLSQILLNALSGAGMQGAADISLATGKALAGGSKKLGARVLNSLLKPAKEDLKAGKNLGREILDRTKLPRSLSGYENLADEKLVKNEEILQNLLKSTDKKVSTSKMLDEISSLKKGYEGVADTTEELSKIDEVLGALKTQYGDSISAPEANDVKRKVYKLIQSKAYKTNPTLPVKTDIKKSQAKGLRKAIEDIIPEAQGVNKELATYGTLKDRVTDIMAGNERSNLTKGTLAGIISDLIGTDYAKSISAQGLDKILAPIFSGSGKSIYKGINTAKPTLLKLLRESNYQNQ